MTAETLFRTKSPEDSYPMPTETEREPNFSDPNSPDLDRLLDQAHGSVIKASRILLDGMINGSIK